MLFRFYPPLIIFTNPSALAEYDTRSIFKRSLTGLNSEFSFSETSSLTKAEEPSPSYYLSRIIRFIPFPMVLVLCEMRSVLARIWTHVAVPISYDDNRYTGGTSIYFTISFLNIYSLFLIKQKNFEYYLDEELSLSLTAVFIIASAFWFYSRNILARFKDEEFSLLYTNIYRLISVTLWLI